MLLASLVPQETMADAMPKEAPARAMRLRPSATPTMATRKAESDRNGGLAPKAHRQPRWLGVSPSLPASSEHYPAFHSRRSSSAQVYPLLEATSTMWFAELLATSPSFSPKTPVSEPCVVSIGKISKTSVAALCDTGTETRIDAMVPRAPAYFLFTVYR